MILTVFLDAGPLGLVTNPKKTPDTIAAAQWIFAMEAARHRFIVPAIADYEVRRELVRAGKRNGITRLNAFTENIKCGRAGQVSFRHRFGAVARCGSVGACPQCRDTHRRSERT